MLNRIRQGWREFRLPADEYVERLVLEVIDQKGEATGYDILDVAWSSRGLAAWRCSPITIYHALKRLQRRGITTYRTRSDGRRYHYRTEAR